MKTYSLMVSKTFMATHPRRGEPTYFMSKILLPFNNVVVEHLDGIQRPGNGGYGAKFCADVIRSEGIEPKIHTFRENYGYWARVANEVNAGRGILSLRQWSGSPYNYKRDGSKPIEFLQLTKMGVQKAKVQHFDLPETANGPAHRRIAVWIDGDYHDLGVVAKNDGLSERDFIDWFKKDLDGCVIHFTDNRYLAH